MNSSAALKAFVGRHGGAVCTSTNARAVLEWAFRPRADGGAGGEKVLFFPDQHLGRNTGLAMGYSHDDMRVWNPRLDMGGLSEADLKSTTFLLWKGHCSVHQRFRPEHVAAFRAEHPEGIVVVHPECAIGRVRAGRPGRFDGLHHPGGRSRRRRGRSSASARRSTSSTAWTRRPRTRRSSRSTR